ncbi:c2h2 type zinc finger domain containing protein [Grosmannia clavigera kw1407]|uniref:C2h2 type zinc finger domain containing protein n=1 Tax=Grosmannia clavigera (strain kw1407 / UAMH 11150) TaxID=655863 RepID=F0XC04_GROCL|nr:c2h2 type zinc finger domain containing protein [Grosmannia clavigera kw1407]EFX04396.1 c2h2 type zinc finger domain containing protein [Grosmannia clavigera kw1407]
MGGGDRRHTISDTQDGSIPGGVDSGSRDNGRTKAFVCEIPQHECKKQFSTKAELKACTNSAKKWPRADNFRGHLINVHKLKKDVDLNYHFVPERHDMKHQKRHDRPYGCTAPNCNKVFGSKNDWKRHERGQHFKLETWKCQEKVETTSNGSAASDEAGNKASNDASGKPKLCDRRFYLCEEFMSHLEEHHGICEARKREEKAKCCLSGGKHDQHWSFWCGFCKTKIPGPSDRDNALRGSLSGPGKKHNKKRGADEGAESKSKGGEMAKDFDAFLRWRSDHIDAHFVGRGENNKQDISKWVHMDAAGRLGNQAAGSSSSAAQKRGYERAAGGSRGGRLPFKKRKTAVNPGG